LFSFPSLCVVFFFLRSFTFENERSAVGLKMWKNENTPIFYNSEGSHIVRLGWHVCRLLDGTCCKWN
jgi:hypothetical protein